MTLNQIEYKNLDARQVQLQVIISKSDAHAIKCSKLGISFEETYPNDLAEYMTAITEYNQNEERMKELKALIEEEAREAENQDNIEIEPEVDEIQEPTQE
jgi:hypothetical protein